MPTNKKKQSRLARLGAKLKTPKGRLLATVLVFAVIGGGILVYRSFAATQSWGYNIAYGNLNATAVGSCQKSSVYDSQYKLNVWSAICPQSATWGRVDIATTGSYLPRQGYYGSNYRFCAYIKGSSPYLTVTINTKGRGVVSDSRTQIAEWRNFSSAGYGYFCSPYMALQGQASGFDFTGIVGVGNNSSKSTWINVGGIVLERQ